MIAAPGTRPLCGPRPVRCRLAGAVASVLALAGVAGCGVPLDESPQAITRTTVASAPPAEMTTTPGPDAIEVLVYFLDGEKLAALPYPVASDPPPTLSQAIGFVLADLQPDAPQDPPLQSAVPPETNLLTATVSDGLASIDLSSEMNDTGGDKQKEAFAQLVFTAMAFDGLGEGDAPITAVTFRIAGVPIDAPTDEGNQTRITTEDYQPPLNPK